MNGVAFVSLGPFIALAATVVVSMMAVAIRRSHRLTVVLTLLGLAIAFVLVGCAGAPGVSGMPGAPGASVPLAGIGAPLLVLDEFARFYMRLILAATAAVTLLSIAHFDQTAEQRDEYYMLLVLAALGSIVLVSATHFVSFFLGLELLSVSLYGLIAYPRTREQSIEAGIKYLVLAATSAAFLLFGMALVYAELGTLSFAALGAMPASTREPLVALTGVGLIVAGFGFKLALVPFHLWTPDVYQGAPAPVSAFVATVSKGAMFALLVRYFSIVDLPSHPALTAVFVLLAIASMVAGNLLALLQRNIKRLLAYSSIAHLGYLLVAFLASGPVAAAAVTFYLVAYFVTMLGAFGVVTVLSSGGREADNLDDYRGLVARRPWLAALFTAMLLSLAGIPLTAGFVGKFYLTIAAGSAGLWPLLAVMMVTSGIGLFYYLRVVVVMFMVPAATGATGIGHARVPLAAGLALAALTVMLIWFGVYPEAIIAFIRSTVAGPPWI